MLRFSLLLASITSFIILFCYFIFKDSTPSYYLETSILLSVSVWVTVKKLRDIKSPEVFTTVYLGSIVLQLLLWIGYLGVVFYLDNPGIQANAIYFLVNCLIFISIEVIYLLLTKRR